MKQHQTEMSINCIEAPNSSTIMDAKQINEAFRVFFGKLYTVDLSAEDIQVKFLKSLNIPISDGELTKL